MSPQPASLDWGTWMLGDMPGLLTTAMDVVGPSAGVIAARIYAPGQSRALPEVQLEVASSAESLRLREEAEESEFVSVFEKGSEDVGWACFVAGPRLELVVSEDA